LHIIKCFFVGLYFYIAGSANANTADQLYEEALQAFNANQLGESIVLLKNTMFANPKHLSGRILLGRAYLVSGEFENAEKQFRQAISDGADKGQLVVPLGQSFLMQGKYEQLLREISVSTLPSHMQTELYSLRGRAHLELNQYELANEQFQFAIDSNSLEPVGFLGLAITALKLGDIEQADNWVEKALALSFNNAEALLLKGDIYFRKDNFKLAKEFLTQSLSIEPNGLRARLLVAEIFLSESNVEKALEHIRFVLEKKPNYPNVNLLYAFALVQSGEQRDAIKVAKNLSEILSRVDNENLAKYPSLRLIQGTSLYMQESWENAYNHLNFYARKFSGHQQSHILVANMDIKFKRYDSALQILQHYTGKHKSLEFFLLNLQSLVNLGSLFEALVVVDNSLAVYPKQIELLEYKVKLLLATGDLPSALSLLESIYNEGQANEQLALLLGQLQLGVSELKKAKSIVDELGNKETNNPVYLSLSAGIDLQMENLDDAKVKLEKAIFIAPKMLQLYVNLYYVYLQQGNIKLAVDTLHAARKISPSEPLLIEKLAQVSEQVYNLKTAVQWRKTLYQLTPNNLDNLVHYADDLISLKQAEEALDILLPRRIDYRLEPQYLSRLAAAHVEQRQCSEADQVLGILTGLSLSNVEQLATIAKMYMRCGRYELAHRALSNAENRDIKNTHVLLTRAQWFLSINQAKLALKLVAPLVKQGNVNAIRAQISAYEALSDYQSAIDSARMLFDKSGSASNIFKLYNLLKRNNQKEDGIKLLEDYLENNRNKNIRRVLAKAYFSNGNLVKSEENYLILAKGFQDASAYRQLSIIKSRTSETEALTYAKHAYELDNNSPSIAATYGWLLVKNGQYDKGLSHLRYAHARNARQPTLLYRLAETLILLGEPEQAKSYLIEAVKYDFPHKENALKRLNTL